MSLINTFPQPSTYDEFLTNDSAEPMEEAKHNLRSFIDTLITVRTDLLRNIPDVKVPKSNKRHMSDLDDEEARNLDDDAWQTKAWKDIEGLDEGWRSYRNNTLEKWSNKVQIASGIPLNKKFKAMNQVCLNSVTFVGMKGNVAFVFNTDGIIFGSMTIGYYDSNFADDG